MKRTHIANRTLEHGIPFRDNIKLETVTAVTSSHSHCQFILFSSILATMCICVCVCACHITEQLTTNNHYHSPSINAVLTTTKCNRRNFSFPFIRIKRKKRKNRHIEIPDIVCSFNVAIMYYDSMFEHKSSLGFLNS